MLTKQQILDDFILAFKSKDDVKKRTLEAVKSEILVVEKAKGGGEASGDKIVEILKSMAKKRRESIAAYEQGGRDDLLKKEQEELKVIESYLPEQMPEEEVRKAVESIVKDNNFSSGDFGKAMGAVMADLKGKAGGAIVSKVLKEVLG